MYVTKLFRSSPLCIGKNSISLLIMLWQHHQNFGTTISVLSHLFHSENCIDLIGNHSILPSWMIVLTVITQKRDKNIIESMCWFHTNYWAHTDWRMKIEMVKWMGVFIFINSFIFPINATIYLSKFSRLYFYGVKKWPLLVFLSFHWL